MDINTAIKISLKIRMSAISNNKLSARQSKAISVLKDNQYELDNSYNILNDYLAVKHNNRVVYIWQSGTKNVLHIIDYSLNALSRNVNQKRDLNYYALGKVIDKIDFVNMFNKRKFIPYKFTKSKTVFGKAYKLYNIYTDTIDNLMLSFNDASFDELDMAVAQACKARKEYKEYLRKHLHNC